MRFELVALAFLAACASTPERAAFSFDELLANAPAYAAQRYDGEVMPEAMIDDLRANGFSCSHRAMVDECVFAESVFASCFDVFTVRLDPAAPVHAERNRRCTGALPPTSP